MQLNFGGALAGLGHGLATIGTQGIEEQQRVRADQRITDRETALAQLQHQYHEQDQADEPADYAALTPAVVAREAAMRPIRQQERIAEITAQAAVGDHHLAVEHGYRTQEQATEHGYRLVEGDAAESRRVVHNYTDQNGHPVIVYGDGRERTLSGTSRAPEGQDPGAVVHRYVNSDNHPVLVTRDGNEIVLPGTVRQNHADDLGLDDNGASGGGSSPAPPATGRGGRPVLAAPGAATRDPNAPPIPGAARAADGNWYIQRNGRYFRVEG